MPFKSPVLSENETAALHTPQQPVALSLVTAQGKRLGQQPSSHQPARHKPDGRAGRKLSSPFRDRPLLATAANGEALPVSEVDGWAEAWFLQAEGRHTPATIAEKRDVLRKFAWFLEYSNAALCDPATIDLFLAYVKNGHEEPGGRWGRAHLTTPVRPVRVRAYYNVLHAFFRFVVRRGGLAASPLDVVEKPAVGKSPIHVFTREEINALLKATALSWHPRRDRAIVLFLYDTGVRATELCELKYRHLDIKQRRIRVHGKGDKFRMIGIGDAAFKALWDYLREEPRTGESPLFMADRGRRAGNHLRRYGLLRLVQRLGAAAGIEHTRCSPHTFRHTFATDYLRAGGDLGSLQDIMGHTTPTMTKEYVHLAAVDVCAHHRKFSPADRL